RGPCELLVHGECSQSRCDNYSAHSSHIALLALYVGYCTLSGNGMIHCRTTSVGRYFRRCCCLVVSELSRAWNPSLTTEAPEPTDRPTASSDQPLRVLSDPPKSMVSAHAVCA